MKRALVTGATGFIGRHVVSQLYDDGYEVIAIARDIKKLDGLKGVTKGVEMDISKAPEDAYLILGSPEVVIHLAWDGLPNYGSLHHFEQEVPRHYAFLKALVEAGLPSLLVTGTCFEYGMQSGSLSEDLPALPVTPYGFAKDILRRQLEYLQRRKAFDLTWCRLFYMYGEGQPAGSLYSQLKAAVKRGDEGFNMSGGEQLRDYLSVEQVAHYIVSLAACKMPAGLVNICAGKPISVRRLVEQWMHEYGWKIHLNLGHYPYPDYEPMAFWGDATRLTNLMK